MLHTVRCVAFIVPLCSAGRGSAARFWSFLMWSRGGGSVRVLRSHIWRGQEAEARVTLDTRAAIFGIRTARVVGSRGAWSGADSQRDWDLVWSGVGCIGIGKACETEREILMERFQVFDLRSLMWHGLLAGSCHATCATCSGPGINQCESCRTTYNHIAGACTCADGSYDAGSTCSRSGFFGRVVSLQAQRSPVFPLNEVSHWNQWGSRLLYVDCYRGIADFHRRAAPRSW